MDQSKKVLLDQLKQKQQLLEEIQAQMKAKEGVVEAKTMESQDLREQLQGL